MSNRLPVIPTVLVAAAVALMLALGVWQLGRAQWKADLLDRYRGALDLPGEVAWPRSEDRVADALYRRSSFTCERVIASRATAGRSVQGASGWAHVAACVLDNGGEAEVALGWSREPQTPGWTGGAVTGFVAPAGERARLVASPPQAGLEPLARPDPNDLPNNHLSYAGQWFFFALTAAIVYWLALRRRWRGN